MAHVYINRKLIAQTAQYLESYAAQHKDAATPMRDAASAFPATERPRFKRAAQRLGWNVCVCRGKVYENGILCW